MPLNLLAKLDSQEKKILSFREKLKDSPVHLERAEAALRSYQRAVGELRKTAPDFHEAKGILRGLELTGPIVRQHQEIVKVQVRDEVLDADEGKAQVRRLAEAANSVLDAVEKQKEDLQRRAGKLDGIHWAARDALEQIAEVLRHYDASLVHEEDDEDWSGRKAAEAKSAKSAKSNGKKVTKKSRSRKRGATKRAPAGESN